MKTSKQILGKHGEDIAASFLEQNGFTILERNFLVPEGEIDLIAEKEEVLHFVEVKTRRSDRFGTPLESISKAKSQKIIAATWRYLEQHNKTNAPFQIDAIGIFCPPRQKGEIEFLENAVIEE